MSVLEGSVVSTGVRSGVDSMRSLARSMLVLGLSLAAFFPLFPAMPSALLDTSWRMALNEAWARGLDFAHGMVFTYGPYAFLATQQYQPDTYAALAICSLLLGAVLFLLLRLIELGSKGRFHVYFILVCLIASGYTSSPDVRFLCFAFLLLVAAATQSPREARDDGRPLIFSAPVVLNLAAFALGLICLVKATYAVEIGALGALGMIALYASGRRILAPAILLSFTAGLAFFWLIAGQPLADLPRFFLIQAQVAAGYGPAMSAGDSFLPPALFLVSALPLAIAVRRELQPPTVGKYAVVFGMALTLFLSFKEGFVRQDDWHVMIAAEMLFILPWCWQSGRVDVWRKVQAALAGATVLVFILMFPYALDLPAKAAAAEQLLHCSDRGPLACPTRAGWLQKTYDLSLARLRAQAPLPKLPGTVDIYTVSQYLAIANGYRWDPRPIAQSYSAYTPALARMNAEHLLGAKAPDGVLFALEAIDWRLPTFDDGPSWPILLTRYSVSWLGIPAQPAGGVAIAYLRHKPDAQQISVTRIPLLEATAALGSRVDIPQSDAVLFARIDIRPNAYGKFEEIIFRESELYINLLYPGGRVERYRFIPGMARAGFVISPVVTDAAQFVALRDLQVRPTLSARRPIAFWLSGTPSAQLMWTDATIEISKLREKHQ